MPSAPQQETEPAVEAPAEAPRTGRPWRWPLVGGALALACATVFATVAVTGQADARAAVEVADVSADADFCRDMMIHHAQAVEMATIVRDHTGDPAVRLLAYDIITSQSNQRGMMLGWLQHWQLDPTSPRRPMAWMGHDLPAPQDGALMPGMATNTQLTALSALSGRDAEITFLRLMIAHHRSGVDMARGLLERGKQNDVRHLAEKIANGQAADIDLMNDMLAERGAAQL
ncbi:DUF305 domain-containing protein [Kitasatospora sp. NPDC004799]|uniref:DUF305 domain-containing protein n=1 Tax=Kitasatospora sp. NPDC004799 TaxID=3154460 RepID=UPI0033AD7F4C